VEEEYWRSERDPIKICATWLSSEYQVPGPVFNEIESQVGKEIFESLEFAINAPFPDASEVEQNVFI
jgi:pyruvate dehydrogenase E1 component alpha subunit